MKFFLLAASTVAMLAAAATAQTEPPVCDPPDTIPPTGDQCPAYDGVEFTFYYSDPEHCQQYWQCLQGCVSQEVCPDGYLFDEFQEMCEPAEDVDCGDRDCDGQPCLVEDFVCPEPEGLFQDPENCIKYQECTDSSPMRKTCEMDSDGVQMWFDVATSQCGDQFVEACNGVPVCDVYDGNCHDAEDFFVTPTPEPDFTCPVSDGWFEDPANCIKYYRCDSYVADRRTCEKSGTTQLHWLQEKEWCDYPSNVDCGDRPICDEFDENCTGGPPPTGGPPGGTCDEIEAQCQANEIFPKGDCEQCYCQCTSLGQATEACCGAGLIWNADDYYCDYPYNVPGCS